MLARQKASLRADFNSRSNMTRISSLAHIHFLPRNQSDRTASLFAPFETREQQVILEQERAWKRLGAGPWDKEEVRREVLLGGGSEELFEAGYADFVAKFEAEQRAIEAGEFHAANGSLFYLVSGRKPG